MISRQAHIFIQVEAAPSGQQRLTLRWHQGEDAAQQGGIHRLHRAAGGQTQHGSLLEGAM